VTGTHALVAHSFLIACTMGAQVSEELTAWASVTDLAAMSVKMKILPALPADCQVEVLRRLWRSLRWLPPGLDIISPREMNDRLFVIVRGEAQAIISGSAYIVLLPEGSYACEAALLGRGVGRSLPYASGAVAPMELVPLRQQRRIPTGVLKVVRQFLEREADWPIFPGRIRTTRRSLVATLARQELLQVVEQLGPEDRASVEWLMRSSGQVVMCNPLQNVTDFNHTARPLGAQDVAALRVVCEGPMRFPVVCRATGSTAGFGSWLDSCRGQRAQEPEEDDFGSQRQVSG